jgi:hypothetical protein
MAEGRGFLGCVKAQPQWQSWVAHHREHNIKRRAAGQLKFGQERRAKGCGPLVRRALFAPSAAFARGVTRISPLLVSAFCYFATFFDLANAKSGAYSAGAGHIRASRLSSARLRAASSSNDRSLRLAPGGAFSCTQ